MSSASDPQKVKGRFVIINQAAAPLFHEMAEGLFARGHEVTFVSGGAWPGRSPGIRLVQGPAYRRDSVAARGRTWLAFLFFVGRELRRVAPGTVVLSSSNPPLLPHLCAMVLGRDNPQVTRILDIYPDVVARHAALGRIPLVRPVWSALNRAAYRRCAAVVTLGERMADTLAQYTDGRRPMVIPNWNTVVKSRIPGRMENPLRAELGLGDRVVVQYSGNIGLAHDLDVMLEAATQLRDDDRVRFLVIGEGPRKSQLMGEVAARKLERTFLFLPYQSADRFPLTLGLADVAVVTVVPGYETTLIPGKVYDHLAGGAAILALTHRPSDLADVVERHGCGRVIAPGDTTAFVKAIMDYANDSEGLHSLREHARRVSDEHFSARACCTRMVDLLEAVAAGRKEIRGNAA